MISFQNKSPLHGISWLRVVLDEGHIIRNPNAQMSKAVLDLKAQRRWILSGIPCLNTYTQISIDDSDGMAGFLPVI